MEDRVDVGGTLIGCWSYSELGGAHETAREFVLTMWEVATEPSAPGRIPLRVRWEAVTESGGRVVIFDHEDIELPPHWPVDSLVARRAVLQWIALQPGDTDPIAFWAYTPIQKAWCLSDACDELRLLLDVEDEGAPIEGERVVESEEGGE